MAIFKKRKVERVEDDFLLTDNERELKEPSWEEVVASLNKLNREMAFTTLIVADGVVKFVQALQDTDGSYRFEVNFEDNQDMIYYKTGLSFDDMLLYVKDVYDTKNLDVDTSTWESLSV